MTALYAISLLAPICPILLLMNGLKFLNDTASALVESGPFNDAKPETVQRYQAQLHRL